MKLQLLSMKLRNFKGCAKRDITFSGRDAIISGENRQGKSTIMDAYMFCMFNTNVDGSSMNIMPSDENGIIRGLKASVECVVSFDGEEHLIKRSQFEKTNKAKTVVTGYTVSCEIDNVAMTLTDFNASLGRFLDVKSALLLSSLGRFMKYPIKERREILTSLSKIPTDEEIAVKAETPSLLEPIKNGVDLQKLLHSLNETEKRTAKQIKLDEAKIEAKQEELNPDIDLLDKNKLNADKKAQLGIVTECIQKMSATVEDASLDEIRELERKNGVLQNESLSNYNTELGMYNTALSELKDTKRTIESELSMLDRQLRFNKTDKADYNTRILQRNGRIDELREKYIALKESIASIEVPEVCFNCGKPLDEDVRQASLDKEASIVAGKMSAINKEAQHQKDTISQYSKKLNDAVEGIQEADGKIESQNTLLSEIDSKIAIIIKPKRDTLYLTEVNANKSKIEALRANTTAPDYTEVIEKKQQAQEEYDNIISDLQKVEKQEDIKNNIDSLVSANETANEELVSMLGQIDEIRIFNDFKINMVEEDVKGFFDKTYFKMFQKNLSNDDYKSICDAYYEGKNFDSSANAERRYNCDIDIIRGLSKRMDLYVPLFKDDCNNVTTLESIEETQEVTLRVEKGKDLTIDLL